MTKYNTIYTDKEYMEFGFTAKEVPMIKRHDELFNKDVDGIITKEEKEEMFRLADELGL